jgi:hypothetical protein
MEKTRTIGAFIGGYLTASIIGLCFSAFSPKPAEAQGKIAWEYIYVEGPRNNFDRLLGYPSSDVLNEQGKKGWEAVGFVGEGHILMKRHR